MSRVLTVSRVYPSYHPRKREPTFFIEQIWNSMRDEIGDLPAEFNQYVFWYVNSIDAYPNIFSGVKYHTIRAGHRFKAGDWVSLRVWGNDINTKSGRSGPYHSKQIIIAPDIQVKKTWDFDIEGTDFYLNGKREYALVGDGFNCEDVAKNDGLSNSDFYDWFTLSPEFKKKKEFHGQIICWNENINY